MTLDERLVQVVPSERQLAFQQLEFYSFVHFTVNTFTDTYYRMTKGRTDAFVRAGAGLGATYSRLWPLLRIDYVLVPDRFKARNCEVHRVKFSDHYPVVAEIEF